MYFLSILNRVLHQEQLRKFFIGKICEISNQWSVKEHVSDMSQRRAHLVSMYGMLLDKSTARCGVFLIRDGRNYPCCGFILRTRPRNTKGRHQLLSTISRN